MIGFWGVATEIVTEEGVETHRDFFELVKIVLLDVSVFKKKRGRESMVGDIGQLPFAGRGEQRS